MKNKFTLDGFKIYINGSKLEGKIGSAFMTFDEVNKQFYFQSFRLDNEATVFMAELLAIDKSMKYCCKTIII